tara:strand:+ start:108 stop:314 length:207 start_codon:yes stop_codon:yes gene_type:complete
MCQTLFVVERWIDEVRPFPKRISVLPFFNTPMRRSFLEILIVSKNVVQIADIIDAIGLDKRSGFDGLN